MLNNQTQVGQNQDRYLGKNEPPSNFVMKLERPHCAWCLCEQGFALGNGSHGICQKHADKILQQYREHRMVAS